ncbi:hypothetical protein BN59_01689 [Legionella massiliensis]|uniref:Lipid/polyisoprenoid-binding YceI-like domain-containing protein n=1 Tax=Legionella massiliensis TaxID=1034943 RepID=A0A078KWT2_9GAMM|nr:YceI family protein [Legionella massiliensis]CDZ77406.1 hypothetical protein BN59_01689 [Legionella massiliensis]CEE13144.1 Protein YceI [Legionella massiliensis]
MTKIVLRNLMLPTLTLVSTLAIADTANWQVVPAESTLSFTATQNNAPVTGQFKTFTAELKCNLAQPETCGSNIKIVVDINSVSDAYNQLSDTLKTAEWFDTKDFPKAVFQTSQVSKTGDKAYEAKGSLTIRDKTQPVTLSFNQTDGTDSKVVFKGTTTIKRTAFGVGTGEWADTNAVKDDVQINFTLSAAKQ